MTRRASLAFLLLGLPLAAQGVFKNADKPTDPTCDRIIRESDELNYGAGAKTPKVPGGPAAKKYGEGNTPRKPGDTTGGMSGANQELTWYKHQGSVFYPTGQRKSIAQFGAVDEKGTMKTVDQLKGKIVLVALWSAKCQPSASMLLELADLYEKRDKFGFEILSVNFDENRPQDGIDGGWRLVQKFKQDNPSFFKGNLPIYLPGIGKNGPSNIVDMVYSLPMLCVVDRQGNLASMTVGYTPNFVVENLKKALVEKAPAGGAQ